MRVLNNKAASNKIKMAYGYYPKHLNNMEGIFSVEYITLQLIIDGAFNRLFNVLCVISMYYCILDPLLHIHPTSTLWCA